MRPEPGPSQQGNNSNKENDRTTDTGLTRNDEDGVNQKDIDTQSEDENETEKDTKKDVHINPGPRGTENGGDDQISNRVQIDAEPQPGPSQAVKTGNTSENDDQNQAGSETDDPEKVLSKPQVWDVKVRILPNIRITRRSKTQKEPIYRLIVKIFNTGKDRTGREWVRILCQGDRPIYSYLVEKSSLTGSQFEAMIRHFMEIKNRRDKGFMSSMVQRVQTLFRM